MTTIERPKGAMTSTVLGSKRMFWLYVVLTALSLIASILDRSWDWASWLRIGLTLFWGTGAVLYFRSWRILSRQDLQ